MMKTILVLLQSGSRLRVDGLKSRNNDDEFFILGGPVNFDFSTGILDWEATDLSHHPTLRKYPLVANKSTTFAIHNIRRPQPAQPQSQPH